MRRKLLSTLTAALLSASAFTQDKLPTWYNRDENKRDIVTRQVGKINEKTQGVVTIYGADWCGACNKLEEQIRKTELDKRLANKGIVFRYVRNQHINDNKAKPRVNKHIRYGSNLNGVPCIFIDDLGRSYKGDKTELGIGHIRKFQGLEKYIRRYTLDQNVHLLTKDEAIKVLEAVASELFEVKYCPLWDNSQKGFEFVPKDKNDPETHQALERLHVIGNAVKIWDSDINKKYEDKKIPRPEYLPTDKQLSQIKVAPGCEKYFKDEIKFLQERRNALRN